MQPGRVTGFLGPNGAGKTTTMRCLLGLVHPTSGRALIDGRPYSELSVPLQRVGAVLEDAGFYPGRNGRDHLRMIARLARCDESRVDEMLELVGLQDAAQRSVGKYSLGMKQRLGLASALMSDPDVLVLDEPANGLDPAGIRWLRELLRERAAAGACVLVSSHVLSEVSGLADDVVILREGRLVAHGPVDELLSGVAAPSLVRTSDNGRFLDILAAAGLAASPQDDVLAVDAPPERVGDLALRNGIAIYALSSESRSLEAVFLEMTGRDQQGTPR